MKPEERDSLQRVWLPLPFFLAAVLVMWGLDLRESYESHSLLLALNTTFTTLVSVLIAVVAGKSFLAGRQPGVLLLGCAMVSWGASAFTATAWSQMGNENITVHNLGMVCSGALHLAAGLMAARSAEVKRLPALWLTLGYLGALMVTGVIWQAAISGRMPLFFIEGQGGTPLRDLVLLASITMYVVSGGVMWARHRKSFSPFLAWYATGLGLLAVGSLGVMLQTVHGGILGWTARAVQYLGGIYMLVGALISARRSRAWELSIEAPLLEEALFRQVMRQALVWPIVALGAALVSLVGLVDFLLATSARVEHSHQVLSSLSKLQKTMLDISIGARGYTLTREPVSRENYERAIQSFPTLVESLESLIADNPVQMEEWNSLWTEVQELEAIIKNRGGTNAAPLRRGRALIDSIRRHIDLMEGREQNLMQERSATLARVRAFILPALLLGFAVLALLVLAIREALALTQRSYRSALDGMEREREQLRRSEEALMAAVKTKDDFLAQLSHELRTPLTPVLMTAAALSEDASLPAEAREGFAMIERNVSLEARLIDDLLDLTRLERGKFNLRVESCDVHHIVQLALAIVREEARGKDIEMTVNLGASRSVVSGDPARLQQVFWNLAGNAVKFTRPGGRVCIASRDAAADPPRIIIEVSDDGIGFHPDAAERILQPFEQTEEGQRHRMAGLGLGLAIARTVVELHQGTLRALSGGEGKGATFTVDLPVDAATSPALAPSVDNALPAGAESRDGHVAMSLLLVEDHEETLQVVRRLLVRAGHEVVGVPSMAAARAAVARQKFDLVLSDIGLPDGSGLELMRELRDRYGLRGIALSGYGMEEDRQRSRDAGFLAHLVKPIDGAELKLEIRRVVMTA